MKSSIFPALNAIGPRPTGNANQADKKNYAEKLSRELAQLVANALRPSFKGILPSEDGRGQESPAKTAKGSKKLDVNYSTSELGLGLGVSIKTITAPDPGTGRYTKNYTRIDNELRAEALDYHKRQPFAVMTALIFLPIDSCDDGKNAGKKGMLMGGSVSSSFGAAVRTFRYRANRREYKNDVDLFERVFIGLYEANGEREGDVMFFDVMNSPPRFGRPTLNQLMTLDQAIEAIKSTFDERNNPRFTWSDEN